VSLSNLINYQPVCLLTTVPEPLGMCDSWKDIILTDWGQVTLGLCGRGMCLMHPAGLAIVALRAQCCKVGCICHLSGIHDRNKREMDNSETSGLHSYCVSIQQTPSIHRPRLWFGTNHKPTHPGKTFQTTDPKATNIKSMRSNDSTLSTIQT
jgi:hypothetical protein